MLLELNRFQTTLIEWRLVLLLGFDVVWVGQKSGPRPLQCCLRAMYDAWMKTYWSGGREAGRSEGLVPLWTWCLRLDPHFDQCWPLLAKMGRHLTQKGKSRRPFSISGPKPPDGSEGSSLSAKATQSFYYYNYYYYYYYYYISCPFVL
jgi:hypothetical protein